MRCRTRQHKTTSALTESPNLRQHLELTQNIEQVNTSVISSKAVMRCHTRQHKTTSALTDSPNLRQHLELTQNIEQVNTSVISSKAVMRCRTRQHQDNFCFDRLSKSTAAP